MYELNYLSINHLYPSSPYMSRITMDTGNSFSSNEAGKLRTSQNKQMILKFPFSSFDPDTLLAIKCKTKHIARIGSKVLIDGKVNGVYINACSSKGIVSVLHLGKTEKEEVVKSYSSSRITFVHNHVTNSNKLMILGNEYVLHPNKNMNTEEVSVMTGSSKTLLSHPSIVERYVTATKIATKMFDAARIKSAQNPRQDNPISSGKCTGIAIIFNTVNRTGTMKATCIYSRIPYLALCSDPYNKWYVSTRNFTKIPFMVRGFVIAYTPKTILSTAKDSGDIESAEWTLGIIASMDERNIVIANVSKSMQGKYSILGFKVFSVGSDLTIHYLNAINHESVCTNGFVVASGINPDIGRMDKHDKELLRKTAEHYIQPKLSTYNINSMKKGNRKTSFIIERLSGNSKNKGSIATLGTHVIVVEGSSSALKVGSSDMQGFLCPRYDPSSREKKSFVQSYSLIPKATRNSKTYQNFNGTIKNFNSYLETVATMNIDLVCLDVSKYPGGIMIVYVNNEDEPLMRIKERYDIVDERKEHWELVEKGVVLSHWIPHEMALENTPDDVKVTHLHHGRSQGYGSGRSVTQSIGGNRYHGPKLSGRAISRPE